MLFSFNKRTRQQEFNILNNIAAVAIVLAAVGYLIGRVGKSNENPIVKRIEEVLYAVSLLTFAVSVFAQPAVQPHSSSQLQAYLNDPTRSGQHDSEYVVRVGFDNTLVVAQLIEYWQGQDDAQRQCNLLLADLSHAPNWEQVGNVWIVSGMAQNEEAIHVCKGSR